MKNDEATLKRDPFYILGEPDHVRMSPVALARREAVMGDLDSKILEINFHYRPDYDLVEPHFNIIGGHLLTRAEFNEMVEKVREFYSHMPPDEDILKERRKHSTPWRNTSTYLHQEEKEGFVYLLRIGDTDCYKIGATSNDPRRRAAAIGRNLDRPVEIAHQFTSDDIFWAEYQLHCRFSTKTMPDPPNGREWFTLDAEDMAVVKRIERFEDGDWIVQEQPS